MILASNKFLLYTIVCVYWGGYGDGYEFRFSKIVMFVLLGMDLNPPF